MRAGIKLFMLTGVAFTFSACYGPPPERYFNEEPEFQQDMQQMEQRLKDINDNTSNKY